MSDEERDAERREERDGQHNDSAHGRAGDSDTTEALLWLHCLLSSPGAVQTLGQAWRRLWSRSTLVWEETADRVEVTHAMRICGPW